MLSQPFLRRFIAFEMQSRRHGGLSRQVKATLGKGSEKKSRPQCPALKPGGRLLREWYGVTHVVDVAGDGFTWNGRPYRSLSAIAREITGAHWSGPRFFGQDPPKLVTNSAKKLLVEHICCDGGVPILGFFVGCLAQISVLTDLADKAVNSCNLFFGRFVCRTDFDTVIYSDQ
ncbi:hypothetical protein RUM8411_03523 [Ruegeria meonggei]|uniref:DUF2924 domain-containing protein n=1 Tax=Ruegeria meonggei TaxID=1446476 RepID=A0A1X7A3Q8_9RHOB|nr:hypothetical protein RUM8411_03523 [Ruegeria meonggei]